MVIHTGDWRLKKVIILTERQVSALQSKHSAYAADLFLLKGCLYYDTCTAYMCAAHVRRTCAMTVYAVHARCFQHV